MKGKSAEEIRKYSLEKVMAAEGKPSYPPRKKFDSPENLIQRTAPKLVEFIRYINKDVRENDNR